MGFTRTCSGATLANEKVAGAARSAARHLPFRTTSALKLQDFRPRAIAEVYDRLSRAERPIVEAKAAT